MYQIRPYPTSPSPHSSILFKQDLVLGVFLDHFPSVRRQQAIAALELAKEMLTAFS
ncbi:MULTISPECIES: hypothetical protein [Microcystis]|uniref:hypothetical protein n=1 Tax=Microcystis TaxID=1125 RepID=UPI00031F1DF7|nr:MULTISPECIES: hypothetical protein [Microcystis]